MSVTPFAVAALCLAALLFPVLFRAVAGPTAADRMAAVNVLATKVIVIIALISVVLDQRSFLDIAIVYALIGFISTTAITKYIQYRRLS
ncbi:MAG: monovalent cation/H+ antiporter complex subunit F [Spirochaetaceae bacterium]